jgi:hypothetical protein
MCGMLFGLTFVLLMPFCQDILPKPEGFTKQVSALFCGTIPLSFFFSSRISVNAQFEAMVLCDRRVKYMKG